METMTIRVKETNTEIIIDYGDKDMNVHHFPKSVDVAGKIYGEMRARSEKYQFRIIDERYY